MAGKTLVKWAAMSAVVVLSGCRWWCDRHHPCPQAAPTCCMPCPTACAPAPCYPAQAGYAPAACAPQTCAPAPVQPAYQPAPVAQPVHRQ